jgi:hypothetical protein
VAVIYTGARGFSGPGGRLVGGRGTSSLVVGGDRRRRRGGWRREREREVEAGVQLRLPWNWRRR